MITAAQVKEKIIKEKEERRLISVKKAIDWLDSAAKYMLDNSTTYYLVTDKGTIQHMYAMRGEPEILEWLENTKFELRFNRDIAVALSFSF